MKTTGAPPRLGLAANRRQFALLVVVNAFVGAVVGTERTVLPLLAEQEFGVASVSAALSFLVSFGLVKAFANLAAGRLADRVGRKRLLVTGWLAGLPVAPLILLAPSWGWVVAANALLGVNQGLAWSMTVIMKIDLAGPQRRGLALGINEAAGYGAVAVAAAATGALAAAHGPATAPFVLAFALCCCGLLLSAFFVRDTAGHVAAEAEGLTAARWLGPAKLLTLNQAGLVNNLSDAMAWGLMPIFLADHGLSVGQIGVVAAVYPASWGLAQLGTGAWSDSVGRKPLIVAGMWVQAVSIAAIVFVDGYGAWITAALGMGLGTALAYPTLIAAVGDAVHPGARASAVGSYRLWRDLGFVAGGLLCGGVADAFGFEAAILVVACLSAASGGVVAKSPSR